MRSVTRTGLLALLLTVVHATPAAAVDLELQAETTPHPGVTLLEYRTSDPATDTWVTRIDLCAPGVDVRATRAPASLQTVASWAQDSELHAAVNGDFYKTGPVRVYGRAIGEGVPWPLQQTGVDPDYAFEWYYEKFGYFAFGHDRVDYSHTEWVKDNADMFTLRDGWANDTVAAEPPLGTLSLVSGFSELVVEGEVITCVTPTDDACFPDRTDMRQRHPRTAMGLSEDRETLLLVVVDGRTPQSSGMYGAELADVMGQLGAHVAINLDGGGSSQMWVAGAGTVNNASGNNNGNGLRAVANHLGVFAGGAGRPGHCASEPACKLIPPPGDTLDDLGPCFGTYGPPAYWRTEPVGYADHLHWTNAFESAQRSNWAWWRLEFAEAGDYELEFYADPEFSLHSAVTYVVVADGGEEMMTVDQGAEPGWRALGTFAFAAGGAQYVAVHDNNLEPVAADQHVSADAVRVTRVGPFCGDGACDPDETCRTCEVDCPPIEEVPDNQIDDDCDGDVDEPPDPATTTGTDTEPGDTSASTGSTTQQGTGTTGAGDGSAGSSAAGSDSDPQGDPGGADEGCGCRSSPRTKVDPALALVALLWLTRRRTRSPRRGR